MAKEPTFRIRLRRLAREAAKFGTVGAVGFLVNVAAFNLCTQVLGLAPIRSGVLATSAAICTNYTGNRYWTYRHRDKMGKRREMGLFLLFSSVGMLIENGVLGLSHYGFGFTSTLADNIAKNIIGLGVASLFRFCSYRTWVFKAVPGAPELLSLPAEKQGEDRRTLPEKFKPATVGLREVSGHGKAEAGRIAPADRPFEDP